MLAFALAAPEIVRSVAAFWSLDAVGGPHRVLPDGCMDFIFNLRTGYGKVVGTMTRAEVFDLPAGSRYFGVRFRPGVASQFLGVRACDLVDGDGALAELGVSGGAELAERVAGAASHAERMAEVAGFLRAPRSIRRSSDRRALRAARAIEQAAGAVKVSAVAATVGLGERQLERLFTEQVGVGPKLFARVCRLLRAAEVGRGLAGSQAELAAHIGYADESHLLREFRKLVGRTPSELARERHVGFVQVKPGAPGYESRP